MRTISALSTTILFLFAFSGIFSSCRTADEEPSRIILSSTETSIPAEGGEFTIALTVENPVSDGEITASPSDEWISVVSATADSICCTAASNDSGQPRTASVSIEYPGIAEPAYFTVNQNAYDKPYIDIKIKETDKTYFIADIIPSDNEMYYMITKVSMDFITEWGYEEDEALFEYEMSYYNMISGATGASMADVIKKYGYTGPTTDMEFNDLTPGEEYLLYSYGIDLETCELLTEITRCPVTTETPEFNDAEFTITPDISGVVIDLSVSPGNYDGYYYIDILSNVSNEDEIEENCNILWSTLRSTMLHDGYSIEEIFSKICCKGDITKRYEMNPRTEYYAVAFAVNEEALLCSHPEYIRMETSDVLPSDNKIAIEFSDVKATSVHLSSTTTNDDTYAFILLEAERVAGMSDEEILTYLTSGTYNLFKTHGNYEETVTGLEPDTEYVAAAFGYVSQTITTPLFKASVKTLSE